MARFATEWPRKRQVAHDGSARPLRYAVIGAGAAGLCATKHLLAAGVEVETFEMGSSVGGLWVLGNDNGRSVAYESLRINSDKKTTQYRDFPFPAHFPFNPSHREMQAYFDAYAAAFDLRRHIRFNTRVTSVMPTGDPLGARWQVVAEGQEHEFDGVVVATGHQAVAAHPPFAERFSGTYLHAGAFRSAEEFRGRNVLVLGTGNSGLDIAADVCTVAERTVLSARSPVLIMPRLLFGRPIAQFLSKANKPYIPWGLQRRYRELITHVTHGRMEQWGFVTPRTRTHPAMHPTLISHIAWGRIEVRPGVTEIQDEKITFADGTVDGDVDVVIAATGYEIDLPFLPEGVLPIVERHLDLYKRVIPPAWDGLYFVGFHNSSGGANIPLMDYQAEWVAALASGRLDRPSRAYMERDIERQRRRVQRRFPANPKFGLETEMGPYIKDLVEELGGRRGWLGLRRRLRDAGYDRANRRAERGSGTRRDDPQAASSRSVR